MVLEGALYSTFPPPPPPKIARYVLPPPIWNFPVVSVRDGPSTVSESAVSNVELSEFFCPHRVPGRELSSSSLLFVYQSELTEFFAELTEFAAELCEFSLPRQCSQNSIPPVSYSVIHYITVTLKLACGTAGTIISGHTVTT